MIVLVPCHACQNEEGLNVTGDGTAGLSQYELTTLMKNCFYRCDPCYADRLFIIEEAAKENAKAKLAAKSTKPKLVVKRSG
jgi:hypothetical protein